MFSKCSGHPTKNCIVRLIRENEIETFTSKLKQLIKFAKKLIECSIIGLQHIQNMDTEHKLHWIKGELNHKKNII